MQTTLENPVDVIPPQALDAERFVLASVILAPELFRSSNLSPDLFYSTENREIFLTLEAMAKENITFDLLAVSAELKKRKFDSVETAAQLDQLLTDSASGADITYHVKALREKANRRKILTGSYEIKNLISADATLEEIGQIIDTLKTSISNKADNSCWSASESRALISSLLLTEPEPFSFVVPGLLTKGVCGFLYGEGGSYKSLAALWLCVQRAAGFVANSKWLDRFEIFDAGKSMFCSIEDQIADVHHRLFSVINRFAEMRPDVSRQAIQTAIEENFHVFPRERWMQDGYEHIVDFEGRPTIKADAIGKYALDNGIDLIILDTLSRLSLVDENDNNGGARLVSALERIRDNSGASVLVIAHSGKAGRTAKTDTHGQNGLRGASALMDNARFGLWFRSMPTKGGQTRLEIVNAKTFRTMRTEPFKVSVDYPAFTFLEDDDAENDLMAVVVEDVRANPGTSQYGTRTRLKKKQNVISQAYRDAIEEGLIICKGGRGKKGGYSIV